MVEGKRVAVVVPAHDEETLIAETLGGIPDFVDRIYVVDDGSGDGTAERARAGRDPRVEVIRREETGGVGAAIVTGYRRALDERIDVTGPGEVGDQHLGPPIGQLGAQRAQGLLATPVEEQVGAALRERVRDRLPDPAGRAREEDAAPVDPAHAAAALGVRVVMAGS